MDIKRMCYELYKVDWKRTHNITAEREIETIQDYFVGLVDAYDEYTYEDYLNEFGYNGELYVCFEEFCEAEYLEEDYITSLLGYDDLLIMYKNDIKEEN